MQTDVQTTEDSLMAVKTGNDNDVSVVSTAPGQLRVIKRNGAVVAYDESKISVAITKAYLAVEGGNAASSSRIHESVAQLGRQITQIFRRRMPSGGTIHIEDIQDQVELALMRTGEHKIARSYVIYRAEHNRIREQKQEKQQATQTEITVTFEDGSQGPLDTARLQTIIKEACEGLEDVSAETIYKETLKNLYTGVNITVDGDVNGDGVVDTNDILAILSAWGQCKACPEDLNGDGIVDTADLLQVLQNFGVSEDNDSDINSDGIVDQSDVLAILMEMSH